MFDVVLVGFDASPSSRRAVAWAAADAASRPARLEIVACYEVPWVGRPPVTVERVHEVADGTDAELAAVVAEAAAAHPGLDVSATTSPGKPRRVLRDAAAHADLVVVGAGTFDSGQAWRSGATARFVARHADAPVVVVPASTHEHAVERVVVGVDGDAADGPAVRWAADDAWRRGVDLVVVHADPDCGAEARAVVDRAAAAARRGRDLTVHTKMAPTDPAPALLAAATMPSIVVIGRRQRTAAAAFALGTCTRALLRSTSVPVAIVEAGR